MADADKIAKECEWAIGRIEDNGYTTITTKGFFRDVIALLKERPVHCSECRHARETEFSKTCVLCMINEHYCTRDYYCADGERLVK